MSILDNLVSIDKYEFNNNIILMGEPGGGKTYLAGTFPKPALYIELGDDNGGGVLKKYGSEIKQLPAPITGDFAKGKEGLISRQLIKYLDELIAMKEIPFKTLIIDPLTEAQDDMVEYYKNALGRNLQFDEWALVKTHMYEIFERIEQLSKRLITVSIVHIKPRESTDKTTGDTYMKVLPEFTEASATRFLKKARCVAYVTPANGFDDSGERIVIRKTIIGGHPLLPTKGRNGEGLNLDNTEIVDCTWDKLEKLLNGKPEPKPAAKVTKTTKTDTKKATPVTKTEEKVTKEATPEVQSEGWDESAEVDEKAAAGTDSTAIVEPVKEAKVKEPVDAKSELEAEIANFDDAWEE